MAGTPRAASHAGASEQTWKRVGRLAVAALALALGPRPALVDPARRGALISPVVSLARPGPAALPEGAPAWAAELNRFPGDTDSFPRREPADKQIRLFVELA
ncbi:unnamed protein product [Durusdinium trenchii]|uniref:Uncharacterized protein n=1 Tax=Durusdinium trenchii TaxID=1381693 RepID=A0ABP0QDS0_9DINO